MARRVKVSSRASYLFAEKRAPQTPVSPRPTPAGGFGASKKKKRGNRTQETEAKATPKQIQLLVSSGISKKKASRYTAREAAKAIATIRSRRHDKRDGTKETKANRKRRKTREKVAALRRRYGDHLTTNTPPLSDVMRNGDGRD